MHRKERRPDPSADPLEPGEGRFRLLVESVRDYAVFMLDPRGHVLTWNTGAERIKGYRADEIIGRHFSEFYPPEPRACGFPDRELEVAARAGSFEDEGWRVRKDGSLFWANVVITAMRDASGQLVGFAKVTRDLTQRRDREEALRQSEERFRMLVEAVAGYAIFMLDVDGKVVTWNAGAQRLKGYSAAEILGRHFSVFYPPRARDSGWPDHELHVAAKAGSFVDTGWRVRKDGTCFWANVTITALRDDAGHLAGFAKLTRDLTGCQRAGTEEHAGRQRDEAPAQADIADIRRRIDSLSRREHEVMTLIVKGLLNKQAAALLDITEITIKVHRRRVMQKMAARSLADLVRQVERVEPVSA